MLSSLSKPKCHRYKPRGISVRAWRQASFAEQTHAHKLVDKPALQKAYIQMLANRAAASPKPPSIPPPTEATEATTEATEATEATTTTTTTTTALTGNLAGWWREDRLTANGRRYSTWTSPSGAQLKSLASVLRVVAPAAAEKPAAVSEEPVVSEE
jgi:hypothetical protein